MLSKSVVIINAAEETSSRLDANERGNGAGSHGTGGPSGGGSRAPFSVGPVVCQWSSVSRQSVRPVSWFRLIVLEAS
ncbi:hypothetical protein K0M31_014731 [Melipona bicolor]|uniref:Uncharacterized protein n=1 Tax=Melipona bicolor TaxID=60889 RepID=A0AA40FGR4_9HYME|nr:hypothetical protein K0M31_014731 [Melipona bicolor]